MRSTPLRLAPQKFAHRESASLRIASDTFAKERFAPISFALLRFAEKRFAEEKRRGHLQLVASPNGADGSLTIHQDAKLYLATLKKDMVITHELASRRHAWLQAVRGQVRLNDLELSAGDGVAGTRVQRELGSGKFSTAAAEVIFTQLQSCLDAVRCLH